MITRWRQDDFLRHNAIFFAGSLGVGFLNYLFYPVLGRLLAPVYFGEVQTLFSLFSHIGAFMNVLGMVAVNIVANQGKGRSANNLVVELEKLTFIIGLVCTVLLMLALRPIANFFNFGSVYPFLGVAVAMLIGVPITFRRAVLQGLKDFYGLSAAGIIGALGKLILAVAAVMAGYKTGGAVLAVVLTQVFTFIYIWRRLALAGAGSYFNGRLWAWPRLDVIRPQLKYAGLVLAVSLIITIQYTIDILAVKHYFTPVQAGLYAGISTIANIIFFITASVSGVLLASVRLGQAGANYQLLRRSFKLVIILGGATLALFTLWPRGLVQLLLGSKYLPAAHYLPGISLAMFLVSLANLCYIYFMARRQYFISLLAVAGGGFTYTLMLAHHTSIQAIINNVIIGSAVLLGLILFYGSFKLSD